MNHPQHPRRLFLKHGLITLTGSLVTIASSGRQNPQEKKEPISSTLVREFVGKAHGDLERVKQLLEQTPDLLNASWDWGGGDYETGLGAAGHMGRADIADFLLSKGGRIDIFCAAMLGKLDIVKSTLTAFPFLKTSAGPHGLTLLHHARQGGEQSKPVLEYLKEVGAS
jgi:hypothetical protein